MTKEGETSYDQQDNPDRWFYEVQNMTKMLQAEDYDTIQKNLKVTVDVIEILEAMRKEAGILFTGE